MGEVTPDTADKIDVWSLGVCLFILVLGFNPFQNKSGINYIPRGAEAGAGPRAQRRARRVRCLQRSRRGSTRCPPTSARCSRACSSTTSRAASRSTKWPRARGRGRDGAGGGRSGGCRGDRRDHAGSLAHAAAADVARRTHDAGRPAAAAPAAGPTAAYRSMAAADDDEAPMNRGLPRRARARLGAGGRGAPRYNACGARRLVPLGGGHGAAAAGTRNAGPRARGCSSAPERARRMRKRPPDDPRIR